MNCDAPGRGIGFTISSRAVPPGMHHRIWCPPVFLLIRSAFAEAVLRCARNIDDFSSPDRRVTLKDRNAGEIGIIRPLRVRNGVVTIFTNILVICS